MGQSQDEKKERQSWKKWFQRNERVLSCIFITGVTCALFFTDRLDYTIPLSETKTTTQNHQFGEDGGVTGSPSTSNTQSSPSVSIPPATILQYAFKRVETTTDSESISKIFLTKSNIFFLILLGKVVLSILAYTLIRLVLTGVQSIEFTQNGFKLQLSKKEELADREIRNVLDRDNKRMAFLNFLSSNQDAIDKLIYFSETEKRYAFDYSTVVQYLCRLLETLPHFMKVGFAPVENGQLKHNTLLTDSRVLKAVEEAFDKKRKHIEDFIFAIPLTFESDEDIHTILYVLAEEKLEDTDVIFTKNAWDIVTYQLDFGVLNKTVSDIQEQDTAS